MPATTTWTDFVNGRFQFLDRLLKRLPESAKEMAKPAGPFKPADKLTGVSVLLAQSLAARGVAASKKYVELFLPHLSNAVAGVTTDSPADHVTVDGVLWFINLAETVGFAPAGSFEGQIQSWFSDLAGKASAFARPKRHSLAFSAVAFEQESHITDYLGEPIAASAPAGATFEFDYPSLIAYLAAACRDGLPFDAAEPAWLDFLWSFPYKLSDESIDWPVLFTAGRIVYHRIGKLPVSDVAREVHKQIMQLIAQGK